MRWLEPPFCGDYGKSFHETTSSKQALQEHVVQKLLWNGRRFHHRLRHRFHNPRLFSPEELEDSRGRSVVACSHWGGTSYIRVSRVVCMGNILVIVSRPVQSLVHELSVGPYPISGMSNQTHGRSIPDVGQTTYE